MSAFLVSLIVSAGAGIWIYNRFQRTSGNNTQQSATAAGVAALIIFIILFFIIKSIIK